LKICRVIGNMVSTISHPDHKGHKLLLVRPLDGQGEPAGDSFIAVDAAQAGVGDAVLVMEEGKGARAIMDSPSAPCEAIVVGVIDHFQVAGQIRKL
jgi:ethanolamine utilization protein EutN